jgi:DNA (cytosine-5)-methyltransferase 1
MRPRLLDLFCKAGGASAGYHAAGFDVTGVDIEPQPDYPFEFVCADALTVDLSGYDVIAASPPCQTYSQATPTTRRHLHPDLIEPVRRRLAEVVNTAGGPWAYVIENVPGAPLHNPVTVCGETLRLGVRRHRLFESNLPLHGTPCWHDRPTPAVPVYGSYGQRPARRKELEFVPSRHTTDHARAAMGIDWMPWPALTQAIPPAYTFWLGLQILTHRPATSSVDSDGSPELTGKHRRETSPTERPPRDASVLVASVTSHDTSDATRPAGLRHDGDGTPSTVFRHRSCRCGAPLPPRPVTGRWPRYCSQACRQAAYRDRQRRTA